MDSQVQFGLFEEQAPPLVETITQEESSEVEEVADPPEATPIVEHKTLEEAGQIPLIDIGEWWEEYWKGMPEFVQKDLEPFKTVYVHFESRKEMDEFSKLVGQKIGINTRSIWYPEAEIGRFSHKRFIDTPPPEENDDIEISEGDE